MSDPKLPYSHSDIDGRTFYHGTTADLKIGDMLQGGYSSNYTERRSPWIYFSETVFAAIWGAELAKGEGPGRIYVVEPTGPFMDDPNVTDRKVSGQSNEVLPLQRPAPRRQRIPGVARTLARGNSGNEGRYPGFGAHRRLSCQIV